MKNAVTFGEIMLRLCSPGRERLFQSPRLEATFGGSEANVAVALARFGLNASFVSAVPEGPIGDACLGELRKHGVDTSFVLRRGERLGIYFLESGSNQRPSVVAYDREGSAASRIGKGELPWDAIFKDARWFHLSGITPALSQSAAEASLEAVEAAKEKGVTVSCDLNYRKKLWKYGKDPQDVMRDLAAYADVIIANEEDCQHSLGIACESDVESGELDLNRYRELTSRVLAGFPHVETVAVTLRESKSADHNDWSAVLCTRADFFISRKYEIRSIVDRVGGGDAFAAGLIFALMREMEPKDALEYAVAASCLKHSIPGDLPLVSVKEVEALVEGSGSGRVQR